MELIGDIHGNFNYLRQRIEYSTEKNIIQVGDFGLGFVSEERDLQTLEALDQLLGKKGKALYVIRGNHDNPKFWDGSYCSRFPSIHLKLDGSLSYIEGKRVLFIGGALSIDRLVRREGIDYWRDEAFDYNEGSLRATIEAEEGVDIVVTHTAPSFCFPRGFNHLVHSFAKDDVTLLEELTTERQIVDRVYNIICEYSEYGKPTHWVYGHFHSDIKEEINETKFILLGVGSTVNL